MNSGQCGRAASRPYRPLAPRSRSSPSRPLATGSQGTASQASPPNAADQQSEGMEGSRLSFSGNRITQYVISGCYIVIMANLEKNLTNRLASTTGPQSATATTAVTAQPEKRPQFTSCADFLAGTLGTLEEQQYLGSFGADLPITD